MADVPESLDIEIKFITDQALQELDRIDRRAESGEGAQSLEKSYSDAIKAIKAEYNDLYQRQTLQLTLEKEQNEARDKSLSNIRGAFGDLKDIFEKNAKAVFGYNEAQTEAIVLTGDMIEKGIAFGQAFGPIAGIIGGAVAFAITAYSAETEAATKKMIEARESARELSDSFFDLQESIRQVRFDTFNLEELDLQQTGSLLRGIDEQISSTRDKLFTLAKANALGSDEATELRRQLGELQKQYAGLAETGIEAAREQTDSLIESFDSLLRTARSDYQPKSLKEAREELLKAKLAAIDFRDRLRDVRTQLSDVSFVGGLGFLKAVRDAISIQKERAEVEKALADAQKEVADAEARGAKARTAREQETKKADEERKKALKEYQMELSEIFKGTGQIETGLQALFKIGVPIEELQDYREEFEALALAIRTGSDVSIQALGDEIIAGLEGAQARAELPGKILARNAAIQDEFLQATKAKNKEMEMSFIQAFQAISESAERHGAEFKSKVAPFTAVTGDLVGSLIENAEQGNKLFAGFVQTAKSAFADLLKSKAKEWAIEAISNAALGFFYLSIGAIPSATSAFTSSGLYALAASAAGVGSALLGRSKNKKQGSSVSSGTGTTSRPTREIASQDRSLQRQLTRVVIGGDNSINVFAGRDERSASQARDFFQNPSGGRVV